MISRTIFYEKNYAVNIFELRILAEMSKKRRTFGANSHIFAVEGRSLKTLENKQEKSTNLFLSFSMPQKSSKTFV